MPKVLLLILSVLALGACSTSDDNGGGGGSASCSNGDQKRFVRDAMETWYFWNDRLPNSISVSNYASPEALLADLTSYSPDDGNGNPIDRFSFIGSAAADQQFFDEGQFEGFGFTRKFLAADDVRIVQVYANSPAENGGLERGQRILELDGRTVATIQAAEGIDAALDVTPLTFLLERPDGSQFETTLAHDLVTIDPVPLVRVIPANDGTGRRVGYVELRTFIRTAEPELEAAFATFLANGVNDLVIDMRYNGGGLVTTANLLGDYLGGDVAEALVFSETQFNADRAAANNSQTFFDRLANSLSLSRLVIIATGSTASASEIVINGMEPHVEVTIVGDTTLGKPVGQAGFVFCEKILRATAFQTVNSDGFGDYFGGLPVDCPAADDLEVAVGDDADPNLVTALAYLENGACPAAVPAGVAKARLRQPMLRPDRRGPPWREILDAY